MQLKGKPRNFAHYQINIQYFEAYEYNRDLKLSMIAAMVNQFLINFIEFFV